MFALSLPYVYTMRYYIYVYLHIIHMDHKIRLLFLVHFEEINGVIVVFHPLHKFTDMLIMYVHVSIHCTHIPTTKLHIITFIHTHMQADIHNFRRRREDSNKLIYFFNITTRFPHSQLLLLLRCYALHLFILV